jgi:LCP family protein required for cell wall assembly
MNFKKRRIRKQIRKLSKREEPKTKNSPPRIRSKGQNQNYINLATIIAGAILIIGLFWVTISIIQSLDFGSLVFSFGKELKTDSQKHTNFLLAGTGGAEHDGSNLTDTLIIASFNEKDKTVKMLSLPRDLYLDDKITGGQRINKIYDSYLNKYDSSPEAMKQLAKTITSVSSISIQYTVKVDFDGFVKIVDALDGVTVDVENAIYDPYYPKGETIRYETFSIQAGTQKLDGETALKYARSRKTTSDFDRANRQQQLLSAIKDKALDLQILTNPAQIQELYNSVADNIETNLSVAEIIELAKIAQDIQKGGIQTQNISDDFTICGGILYTPVRDYFGGAAVLLPIGTKFEELIRFSKLYFFTNFDKEAEIQVLNGTKTPSLALTFLNRFNRDCLNATYYGNASDRALETSTIYYLPELDEEKVEAQQETLKAIQAHVNAPLVEGIPPEYLESDRRTDDTIVVELGADFRSISTPNAMNNLPYTTPIYSEKKEEKDLTPDKETANSSTTSTTEPAAETSTPEPATPPEPEPPAETPPAPETETTPATEAPTETTPATTTEP